MLDIFIWVYVIQRFRITGLKTLEQTNCLLFFVRLPIAFTLALLWLLLQRIIHVFHQNPPIVISFLSHVPDSRKGHMSKGEQVPIFGSVREGYLTLFSGLHGIG